MAVSINSDPFFGCPCNKSPTILRSMLWPLSFGNSHLNMGTCCRFNKFAGAGAISSASDSAATNQPQHVKMGKGDG